MPATSLSVTIQVPDEGIETLFGSRDENLKQLERYCDVQIRTDGHELLVTGSALNIQRAERIVDGLVGLLHDGYHFSRDDVRRAALLVGQDLQVDLRDFFVKGPLRVSDKRQITPKSVNQKTYLDAIDQHDVVFGIGPAGTGKTYLAMAQAVAYLTSKKVRRIILARPAVEAGEKLGFLPGDLQEKVNPYLRPLYDALYDMLDAERVERLIGRDVIEIAPLAFMRGRTLNDAFVILDEAQNTTTEQMKMFLTRLGFGSKAVVTGDITQIDLPPGRTSGVVQAIDILRNIDGMSMVFFNDRDVARHPLVQRVVNAYETSSLEDASHSKSDDK
ncbi:PhoH family protein [bacterium]|nr:MAG: PhoH family protein [bacterium]